MSVPLVPCSRVLEAEIERVDIHFQNQHLRGSLGMKDKLLLSGVKLPANKLGSVADWLDIEQKDVIVSTEGLSNLQKFLECNPRKLSELVKGPKLVSNLMKIISAFTGRSSKQSILLAVSHESSKRHKIEFSTFEKALELMEDLLVGIKNPLNLVKNIPMDQFSDFVNFCQFM